MDSILLFYIVCKGEVHLKRSYRLMIHPSIHENVVRRR
jgi:hypothetical protein